jgi:hypothetical protein
MFDAFVKTGIKRYPYFQIKSESEKNAELKIIVKKLKFNMLRRRQIPPPTKAAIVNILFEYIIITKALKSLYY